MPPKQNTVAEPLSLVESGTGDLDPSEYSNDSDFDLETELSCSILIRKMPPKRSTAAVTLLLVVSDIEDLDLSDYSNDSDFELEIELSSEESDGSDHHGIPVVGNVLPASPLQPRRGQRGAGILHTPRGWGTNTGGFVT